MVYNVSYDLKAPGQNYGSLIEELKRSPSWWHYLNSTWLIQSNESATQLWERIAVHVDRNDCVLVSQITANYSGWLPKEAWDWISSHVGSWAV